MNSILKVLVKYRGRLVGTLGMSANAHACVFQYSPEWLASGFSISPLELPLRTGLFVAKETPFNGDFGIFEDSLPDGYGRYLLCKMLKAQGIDYFSLTPVQMLNIVGGTGMGALSYEPETPIGHSHALPDFDELQSLALDVLSEKNSSNADVLYFNSGNSGGCRPKCLYSDDEGHWLVKFRQAYDIADMGRMEYEYNVAARQCGIDVPDFKLIEGKYFASRRFDIDSDGQRLHTATAAALLRETISPPTADYSTLLKLTGYLTQDPRQVEELYRRMVFNILSANKDDHAKNFSYICHDGKWRLAPAYDLTYNPQGYHGEHATSVNFVGNPGVEDMVKAAIAIHIPRARAEEIIEQTRPICEELLRKIGG